MATVDIRPKGQVRAMALVRSRLGLRISRLGAKKGADTTLDGVVNETVEIARTDGAGSIRARVYKPKGDVSGLPIVVSFHGGGYATGWPERHHVYYERLMKSRPCIVVAPAYRVSIDAPFPAGFDDSYDTVLWAKANAEQLGGSGQIILTGNSSGGGMALACALKATDTGDVDIAFVMSLYPMIDDRASNWTTVPRDQVTWNRENNVFAWHLYLKEVRRQKRYEIPTYAVPTMAKDLSKLPPVAGFVGDRDILCAECEAFVERLKAHGVEVTFKVFGETFHAMEDSAPDLPRSKEIHAWVSETFAQMVGRHIDGNA